MLKTKVKFLIIALGLLVTLCLFNTNTVNATTEKLQNIVDLIPDEIVLNITELEATKIETIETWTNGGGTIEKKINEILEENNVSLEALNIRIQYSPIYGVSENSHYNIHTADIIINKDNENVTKTISLKYSNSDKYNSVDEQYVKNLKINHAEYIEVDLDTIDVFYNDIKAYSNFVNNYYSKIVNDNSIELNIGFGATYIEYGIFSGLGEGATGLGLFKNEVLYDVVKIPENATNFFVPVIDVPNTINEEDLKEYVLSIINNYINKSGYQEPVESTQCTLKKGATVKGVDIPNGYTITFNGTYSYDLIIRQEETSLQLKDEVTNIKINTDTTVLPADTQLVANEIKEGETYNLATTVLNDFVDKMYVYDITLQSNGVKVQPNGKVKVSIPVPEGLDTNKLVVYRIDKEGNKTEYKVKVETIDNIKHATFETNHFSTYVLGEKAEETTTNTESTAKGEKDETPKTGSKNTVINVLGTIAIITIATGVTKKLIK